MDRGRAAVSIHANMNLGQACCISFFFCFLFLYLFLISIFFDVLVYIPIISVLNGNHQCRPVAVTQNPGKGVWSVKGDMLR